MKNILTFICIVFAFSLDLYAQQGGSNYSMFGIGDIRQSIGAGYDGLAGTQQAVQSYHAVNLANPAMWSAAKLTRLQIGFRFTQTAINQLSLSSAQNFGKLDGMAATFQVDTSLGLTISGGIHPYSIVQYSVSVPVIPSIPGLSDLSGNTLSYGQGGLSAAFFGASYKPIPSLSIGIAGLGLFGTINKVVQTELYSQPFISVNQKTDRFSGSGVKFGLAWQPQDNLTIGFSSALYSVLDYTSDFRQSTLNSGGIAYDSIFNGKGTIDLPSYYGIGISYQVQRWMFAIDASLQDFSTMTYSQGKSTFRSTKKLSVGIARLPSYQLGLPFDERIQLNIGAGYQELYYSYGGQNIDEYFGSIGMNIPIAGSAMIDLALQAGIRGKSAVVEEQFLRFGFSISAGEQWFKPFPRE
jgi:hypothetical protein